MFGIRYSRLFWIYLKNHAGKTYNLSVRISVKKIENKVMFEVNTGYYLELLTPEIMKLLESNKSEINKDKNGKYVPNLEITEVIFVHCKIVNNNYQQDSKLLYTFIPNKSFSQLLDIFPKSLTFSQTL